LRERLGERELAAFLVWGRKNVRYLTGFSGSAGMALVLAEEVVLISDFRYRTQVGMEAPGTRFEEVNTEYGPRLAEILAGVQGRVGVEKNSLLVEQWERLQAALPGMQPELVDGLVEEMRMVKGPEEVRAIGEACRLVSAVFERLVDMRVVGRSERDVALDLETWARRQGSAPVPFPYIVASGVRGAMPHAQASEAIIQPGELLVVDIGTEVDGYASDMTRTFATGPLDEQRSALHALVERAQQAGRAAAAPGVACADVDRASRDIIREAGMGDLFRHSLGHGVGLDVHEEPRLSEQSKGTLQENMVVTVEPGVYDPDRGGVRIEDTVVITAQGCRCLTDFPRSLITV